jgi:hypothetical protein
MNYQPPSWPAPPAPRRPRRAGSAWAQRHPVKMIGLIIVGCVVVFAVSEAAGVATPPAPRPQHPAAAAVVAHSSAPTSSPPAPAPARTTTPPPAPHVTRTVRRVVFIVTGSAPGGAMITYGSDSSNLSPPGGTATPPWRASVRLNLGALYYAVSAQLQGDGDIACRVVLRVTRYWSDGTHLSAARTLATGRAENGYNICQAQYNNG